MGRTISIWAVCLTVVLAGFSLNTPSVDFEKDVFTLVESEALTVLVSSDEAFRFFLKADFREDEDIIYFLTRETTEQIRVYDHLGSMLYLLPVGSDRVKVGKSLFDKGQFTFTFDTGEDRMMYSMEVQVH